VAAAAVSFGCGAAEQAVRGAEPLPPELAALRARACAYAAEDEDDNPKLIEVVPTTEREALRVVFHASQAAWLPDRPVWLVQVHGNFTATRAPRLPGAEAPRGRVMHFTAQRGPVQAGGSSWGLANAEVDLSQLGPVIRLHDGATACSTTMPGRR
jgi:hypothetical protein